MNCKRSLIRPQPPCRATHFLLYILYHRPESLHTVGVGSSQLVLELLFMLDLKQTIVSAQPSVNIQLVSHHKTPRQMTNARYNLSNRSPLPTRKNTNESLPYNPTSPHPLLKIWTEQLRRNLNSPVRPPSCGRPHNWIQSQPHHYIQFLSSQVWWA